MCSKARYAGAVTFRPCAHSIRARVDFGLRLAGPDSNTQPVRIEKVGGVRESEATPRARLANAGINMPAGELGIAGLRGQFSYAADPMNLHWVMPAKGAPMRAYRPPARSRVTTALLSIAILGATLMTAACGDGDDNKTVTLVTHESFAVSKQVIEKFEKDSGYKLKILRSDDAGAALNQAILTKDNPQGDVLFGVDNTFLSRALDEKLFDEYRAKDIDKVETQFRADNHVTPVDHGEVCVNVDKAYFEEHGVPAPTSFADLAQSRYKDQLVVENPATSSPGLAFLLGTIAEYGTDGYRSYWQQLKDNGVEVVDGWETAYFERFSGGASKGDKPLAVSYASSPVAEVQGNEPAPTGVATETCFQQIEYAGLLNNAENAKGGRALIDFLLSTEFQSDVPLKMFVSPVRADAEIPEVYAKNAVQIAEPKTLEPAQITKNREQWIKDWKTTVLG